MRDYEFFYTQDGSIGLYSYSEQDVYHSKFGALTEAWEKFILPPEVQQKINNEKNLKVLDICYGIGYNSKALMSFLINKKKLLKNENSKNKIKKILSKLNIDTIDDNNTSINNSSLSIPNDTIHRDIIIDCLEINEDLVKISPLLKSPTLTKENNYNSLRLLISKIIKNFNITRKNNDTNKNNEIYNLLKIKQYKYSKTIKKEYKLNPLVNYIIINALINQYKNDYFNKQLIKLISHKDITSYFDRELVGYAKYYAKNRYNLSSRSILAAFLHNIYYDHLSKRYKKIESITSNTPFKLHFYCQDARKTLVTLHNQYSLIFLDAFTFSKAPQLCSFEFFTELYKHLGDTGIIVTYSNSALIRNSLIQNGFFVGKIYDCINDKYIGTVAAKDKTLISKPLDNYELGLCSTKAGIPYHDKGLNSPKDIILKQREIDYNSSNLLSASKYIKLRRIGIE